MPDPSAFGESFLEFMNTMRAAAPRAQPFFAERLGQHFPTPPQANPIITHRFPAFELPNVQLALDGLSKAAAAAGDQVEVLGITTEHKRFNKPDLSSLIASTGSFGPPPSPGPVEYRTVTLGDGSALACIHCGLLLMRSGDVPIAVMVNGPGEHTMNPGVTVDVMASNREDGERFLALLRKETHAKSVHKGQVLSVGATEYGGMEIAFHPIPSVAREGIILPAALLDRIERQTIGFAQHASTLAASGRHLKRGVLLHGPPGTGKTLTAMYLATRMKGRTVVLVTGRGHGMLSQVCWLARVLQPATVILEDVDLIAQDRDRDPGACAAPLLFDLLNQMDGLAEDADILFVLTTNRPRALEPALAARPGRIDQAIEVPLPDPECRRRLFDLYAKGIQMKSVDVDKFVARTAGASASFVRELIRRSVLLACIDGLGAVVGEKQLDEALRELVLGGSLTRRIMGFEAPDGPDSEGDTPNDPA